MESWPIGDFLYSLAAPTEAESVLTNCFELEWDLFGDDLLIVSATTECLIASLSLSLSSQIAKEYTIVPHPSQDVGTRMVTELITYEIETSGFWNNVANLYQFCP